MGKPKKAKSRAPRLKSKKVAKTAKALLAYAPAAVEELRGNVVPESITTAKGKDIPKGLVEIEVHGSAFKLLGMRNQAEIPTLDQRVAIARRLNEVGPKLPKYVKQVMMEPKPTIGATMGKTNPAGLDPKEIQKAFEQGNKETAAREKQMKKETAKKAKEDEARQKKEAAARKKLKASDVTPKPSKPSDSIPLKGKTKDIDPKAQVKGISSPPPAKPKAGMNPGAVPKGGFTKENKPTTSGELIRARIGEHKLTDDAIAAEVRKLWPGRTTAVSDVRWNRSQMQKAGVKSVPEPVEGSTVPGKRK